MVQYFETWINVSEFDKDLKDLQIKNFEELEKFHTGLLNDFQKCLRWIKGAYSVMTKIIPAHCTDVPESMIMTNILCFSNRVETYAKRFHRVILLKNYCLYNISILKR